MKNYKKLLIWTDAMVIVELTYEVVKFLPADERFGLRNQMTRAAVSIVSNIAEGSAYATDKHYGIYIQRAMGSVFELSTQLEVCRNVFKLNDPKIDDLERKLIEEGKMLNSFLAKLT
jgi:four helix bundle protein